RVGRDQALPDRTQAVHLDRDVRALGGIGDALVLDVQDRQLVGEFADGHGHGNGLHGVRVHWKLLAAVAVILVPYTLTGKPTGRTHMPAVRLVALLPAAFAA